MWRQVQISDKTHFIFCKIAENKVEYILYNLKESWCAKENWNVMVYRAKALNIRIHCDETLVYNTVQNEDPIQANWENLDDTKGRLRLKYNIGTCPFHIEWCLHKQPKEELQNLMIAQLFDTVHGMALQNEELRDAVVKKDVEILQFKKAEPTLKIYNIGTPFLFTEFDKKFSSTNKFVKCFQKISELQKKHQSIVEGARKQKVKDLYQRRRKLLELRKKILELKMNQYRKKKEQYQNKEMVSQSLSDADTISDGSEDDQRRSPSNNDASKSSENSIDTSESSPSTHKRSHRQSQSSNETLTSTHSSSDMREGSQCRSKQSANDTLRNNLSRTQISTDVSPSSQSNSHISHDTLTSPHSCHDTPESGQSSSQTPSKTGQCMQTRSQNCPSRRINDKHECSWCTALEKSIKLKKPKMDASTATSPETELKLKRKRGRPRLNDAVASSVETTKESDVYPVSYVKVYRYNAPQGDQSPAASWMESMPQENYTTKNEIEFEDAHTEPEWVTIKIDVDVLKKNESMEETKREKSDFGNDDDEEIDDDECPYFQYAIEELPQNDCATVDVTSDDGLVEEMKLSVENLTTQYDHDTVDIKLEDRDTEEFTREELHIIDVKYEDCDGEVLNISTEELELNNIDTNVVKLEDNYDENVEYITESWEQNENVDKLEDDDTANSQFGFEELLLNVDDDGKAKWQDVIKMEDFAAHSRRMDFWQEPTTRRVLGGIKNKEIGIKTAAQLLGVSYSSLYTHYSTIYGSVRYPYMYNKYGDKATINSGVRKTPQAMWPKR